MRRSFVLVLGALVFLSGALWAGGGTEQAAAAGSKPATISWYYPGNYPQRDQDLVFAELNKVFQKKINTTVDFKPLAWGDYDQKMQVIISSGEQYDLCYTANWINNYIQNVGKGAFVPLDDLLQKYAPTLWKSVPAKIWAATKVKGKIYGIINYQISCYTSGMAFPKALVDKYKFDVNTVKKLEDVEPYLKAVKAGEPGISMVLGVANTAGTTIGYVNAYLGFEEIGGRAIPGVIVDNDPNMKVQNQFKTQKFVDWIKLMRKWYQAGYIREDAVAVTDINPNLSKTQVGCWFVGTYKPGGDAEDSARVGYTVLNIPISQSLLQTDAIIATMHAISVTSKNPDRAMQLMEILNTDVPTYNLMAFGIEGKHYTKTAPNRVQLVKDSGYQPSTLWMHASTFNAYLLPGQPDDVWEKTRQLNMNATQSVIIGFSFDPTPVNAEISQCESVRKEYLPALELGTVDPDKVIPEFVDKLDKAGAPKLIAEMQRQINAWKATK
jgi:putative aldouronate transport system substrate-binding protein